MIELLLERGAHVVAMTPQRETALCMAASHGKKGAAGVLLRQSLEVLTEDQKAMVMISAARAGSLEVVELLVGQGFSVNACDDSQLSALEAAAVQHHESVVIFLLRNGARPNSPAIRATRQIHNKRIRGLLSGALPLPTQQDMSGEISLDNVLIDRDSVQAALAGISTNAWRRRVMPTANPGGRPPNCWVCRDLDFRRGRPQDVEVMFLVTGKDLAWGAEHRCPRCTMIRQCLARLATFYKKGLATWGAAGEAITLLSLVRGGPLYIVPGPVVASHQAVRAEIYSHPSTFYSSLSLSLSIYFYFILVFLGPVAWRNRITANYPWRIQRHSCYLACCRPR
jgi:hypothetical protein